MVCLETELQSMPVSYTDWTKYNKSEDSWRNENTTSLPDAYLSLKHTKWKLSM